MKVPCHECKDRTTEPNCHIACERYKEYEAKRELIRDNRAKQKLIDGLYPDNFRKKRR